MMWLTHVLRAIYTVLDSTFQVKQCKSFFTVLRPIAFVLLLSQCSKIRFNSMILLFICTIHQSTKYAYIERKPYNLVWLCKAQFRVDLVFNFSITRRNKSVNIPNPSVSTLKYIQLYVGKSYETMPLCTMSLAVRLIGLHSDPELTAGKKPVYK